MTMSPFDLEPDVATRDVPEDLKFDLRRVMVSQCPFSTLISIFSPRLVV
jgi:hypothetical protein